MRLHKLSLFVIWFCVQFYVSTDLRTFAKRLRFKHMPGRTFEICVQCGVRVRGMIVQSFELFVIRACALMVMHAKCQQHGFACVQLRPCVFACMYAAALFLLHALHVFAWKLECVVACV